MFVSYLATSLPARQDQASSRELCFSIECTDANVDPETDDKRRDANFVGSHPVYYRLLRYDT
jgi:hypothetical protein